MGQLLNYKDMDTSEIIALGQQGVYIVLDRMLKDMEEIESKRLKDKESSEIAISEVNKIAEDAKAIAVSAKAVKKGMDNYITLSDFGDMFLAKIGSQRVGHLFRVIGLAKRTEKKTSPYDKCVPKYSKLEHRPDRSGIDRPYFYWHYNSCKEKLDEWLKEHCLYEEFYALSSNGKTDKYIKDLYARFKCGDFD